MQDNLGILGAFYETGRDGPNGTGSGQELWARVANFRRSIKALIGGFNPKLPKEEKGNF